MFWKPVYSGTAIEREGKRRRQMQNLFIHCFSIHLTNGIYVTKILYTSASTCVGLCYLPSIFTQIFLFDLHNPFKRWGNWIYEMYKVAEACGWFSWILASALLTMWSRKIIFHYAEERLSMRKLMTTERTQRHSFSMETFPGIPSILK